MRRLLDWIKGGGDDAKDEKIMTVAIPWEYGINCILVLYMLGTGELTKDDESMVSRKEIESALDQVYMIESIYELPEEYQGKIEI